MAQSLVLDLSDDVYQYLHEVADQTQQSMGELIAQSIAGNLPPRMADAPVEMQAGLLQMQQMSAGELREIANSQMPAEQQIRHAELLEMNAEGAMSEQERSELATLRLTADQLMLRKAYAWSLLRWRGYPSPTLHEIQAG